jgi:hypothetical protein
VTLVGSTGCPLCDKGQRAGVNCCGDTDPHHHTTKMDDGELTIVASVSCTAPPILSGLDDGPRLPSRRGGRPGPRQCGQCREYGHTITTCGRSSKYVRDKYNANTRRRGAPPVELPTIGDKVRAQIEREIRQHEQAFEISEEKAARIVERLRPLCIRAMTSPTMLESLIVSCYLAGMVDASKRDDAKGGP